MSLAGITVSAAHFEILENGARPFHIWDGLAWCLRQL